MFNKQYNLKLLLIPKIKFEYFIQARYQAMLHPNIKYTVDIHNQKAIKKSS